MSNNSYGHMMTGLKLKVSVDRVEKPGIKAALPGLQRRHYTTAAPEVQWLQTSRIKANMILKSDFEVCLQHRY